MGAMNGGVRGGTVLLSLINSRSVGPECLLLVTITVKPALSDHPKRRQNIGFHDRLLLNAGQKDCRMLQ